MNDRHLYKAKRTDNGEWVEGYLYRIAEEQNPFIMLINRNAESHEVDLSTICQYTGLTDKNGKMIWENDIVKFEDIGEEGYEYKEGFDYINKAKVVWSKGRFELDSFLSNNSGTLELMNSSPEEFYDMFEEYEEVIGNIFDNPSLLEGGTE